MSTRTLNVPQGLRLEVDGDVEIVLAFMQENIEARKLIKVANAVKDLGIVYLTNAANYFNYVISLLIFLGLVSQGKNGKDGEAKAENYFSGSASLVFCLRGWGFVSSILRRTSSGLGSSFPRLRGFFSLTGKSSENQKTPSAKDALKDWVGEFLSYWEDSNMLAPQAAEIIVNAFFKAYSCPGDLNRKARCPLPEPQSFFEAQEE